jgi:dTMP kinase
LDSVKRRIVKKFVVFEGLDGAGTTTQIEGIHRRFSRQRISSFLTCEPTNSPIGRIIRNVLEKNIVVRSETLALLFAADRNEHLWGQNGMMEHLAKENIVLCDRYIFSSLAYQTLESSYAFVWELNSRFPLPEYLFFVDVPPEECQNRMELRNTKEIFDEIQFQHKIRQAYLDAFRALEQTGMKTYIIDGTGSVDDVEEKIWNILEKGTILKT